MAQLSIPQSLIGALIDIADLGTLDSSRPPNDAPTGPLYDAQRPGAPLPLRTRRQHHHRKAL